MILRAAAPAESKPPHENLTSQRLDSPREIQGYPCAATYAWFFANGKLKSCQVSREIPFGEITVPAKSWINLNDDGSPAFVFLGHDAKINGYLCKGGGGTEGPSTALYPSGKLKTCWLAEDTLVNGVPCMHASFLGDVFGGTSELDFFESGAIKGCKLSRDFTVDGRSFHRGDRPAFPNASGSARTSSR
jgi:hypothetical protein